MRASAGSAPLQAPSVEVWQMICAGVGERYPDATFHFTGVSRRTGSSTARTRSDVMSVAAAVRSSVIWWNKSLREQLALIAACDVLIAPHTGFAFFASAVDAHGSPCRAAPGRSTYSTGHPSFPYCRVARLVRRSTTTTPSVYVIYMHTVNHSVSRTFATALMRLSMGWPTLPIPTQPTKNVCVDISRPSLTIIDAILFFLDGRESLLQRIVRRDDV